MLDMYSLAHFHKIGSYRCEVCVSCSKEPTEEFEKRKQDVSRNFQISTTHDSGKISVGWPPGFDKPSFRTIIMLPFASASLIPMMISQRNLIREPFILLIFPQAVAKMGTI